MFRVGENGGGSTTRYLIAIRVLIQFYSLFYSVIQAMDEERARFKTFVMKYETELNKSESRLSEILSQLFSVYCPLFF